MAPRSLLLACLMATTGAVFAGNNIDAAIADAVHAVNPKAKIKNITPSPIKGIQQVTSEGAVVYISNDGRYLIHGEIYDIKSRSNLTALAVASIHKDLLASSNRDSHIRFGSSDATETLYVFTDITCGYCRKFHQEVPELNALGIAVEYLAYPRSGPTGPTADVMGRIWCSKDRQESYAGAIAGKEPDKTTCNAPIAAQYKLGTQLEVQGTPAIFAADGRQLGGYLTAKQIKAALSK